MLDDHGDDQQDRRGDDPAQRLARVAVIVLVPVALAAVAAAVAAGAFALALGGFVVAVAGVLALVLRRRGGSSCMPW
jgi:uncharacterized protein (DUF2062 family)